MFESVSGGGTMVCCAGLTSSATDVAFEGMVVGGTQSTVGTPSSSASGAGKLGSGMQTHWCGCGFTDPA